MNISKNQIFNIFLIILLIVDFGYSYYQYSQSAIDGDFPAIVSGSGNYEKVMEDPLGFAALSGEKYAATNRYSAHAFMSYHFKFFPKFLQNFVSPIDSLFLAIAITKLLVHILFLGVLSYFVSGFFNFRTDYMLYAAVLISPLIHYGGEYFMYFQIIDPAITYVMFYTLPIALTLLFLLPFYKLLVLGKISNSPVFIIGWIVLAIVLSLFGPLTSPILILAVGITFIHLILKNFYQANSPDPFMRLLNSFKKIPTTVLIIFPITLLAALYSMYIGTKNTENEWYPTPLTERFSKLWEGINVVFMDFDSGVPYLLIVIIFNFILLYIFYRHHHRLYFKLVFFLTVFCILYIVMLPLGGYREYRPVILRRDTLLPVLCIIFFFWASSSLIIVRNLKGFRKLIPLIIIIPLLYHYTITDLVTEAKGNNKRCQKEHLHILAESTSDCVTLKKNCFLAGWSFINRCEDSVAAALLFHYYNITPKVIHYKFDE